MRVNDEVRGGVRRRLVITVLALAIGIGLALPSSGSVIEKISIVRLQNDAEAIAVARVVSSKSVTRGCTIQTETLLSIDRSWRGPRKGTLLVRTAGGRANGVTLLVRGEPQFSPGQEVLVFLYRSGDAWRPVGMFQGVWLMGGIERDARSIGKTQPTQDGSVDSAERMLVRPSGAHGAKLMALEPGPYAVDGGPRLISELLGKIAGGRR